MHHTRTLAAALAAALAIVAACTEPAPGPQGERGPAGAVGPKGDKGDPGASSAAVVVTKDCEPFRTTRDDAQLKVVDYAAVFDLPVGYVSADSARATVTLCDQSADQVSGGGDAKPFDDDVAECTNAPRIFTSAKHLFVPCGESEENKNRAETKVRIWESVHVRWAP